ncbi:hypothetical protein [Embleya sp. NPDC005971]|uniref:hypothetical protein n=1 Tax=Embleya sp. NPDC005971 TaxID=3156724 RepID=UPI00340EAB1E
MLADADEGICYSIPTTAAPTTASRAARRRRTRPRGRRRNRCARCPRACRPRCGPGRPRSRGRPPRRRAARRPGGPTVGAYHPDCPEALIPALVRRQPGYFSHGSIRSPAVARALIADPPVRDLPIRGLGDPLYEGLLTPSEIPTGARAAGHALIVCHGYARDLVRTHLRDDADAWTVASNPLRDFTRTPTELPTTAATVTS